MLIGSVMETTIYFSQQLRFRWPNPLAKEWATQYPLLFDEDDLRITRLQPLNHFCE